MTWRKKVKVKVKVEEVLKYLDEVLTGIKRIMDPLEHVHSSTCWSEQDTMNEPEYNSTCWESEEAERASCIKGIREDARKKRKAIKLEEYINALRRKLEGYSDRRRVESLFGTIRFWYEHAYFWMNADLKDVRDSVTEEKLKVATKLMQKKLDKYNKESNFAHIGSTYFVQVGGRVEGMEEALRILKNLTS